MHGIFFKTVKKPEFRLSDTVYTNDGIEVLKSSEGMGWSNIYAQISQEDSLEAICPGSSNIWLTLALQPLKIWRRAGEYEDEGKLPADSIFIAGNGESIHTAIKGRARGLHLFVKPQVFDEVAHEMFGISASGRPLVDSAFGLQDRALSLLMRSVKLAMDDLHDVSGLKADLLAHAIAAHVVGRKPSGSLRASGYKYGLGNHRLKIIMEYMHDNLGSSMRLPELAHTVGLGNTAFIAQFKESVGQTPHQYVMKARIEKACDLLSKTNIPLSEIAYACGFSDQAHMSSAVKRAMGVTPLNYRSNFR